MQSAREYLTMDDSVVETIRALFLKRKEQSRHLQSGINPFSLERDFIPLDPYPLGANVADFVEFLQLHEFLLPKELMELLGISNGAAGFFGVSDAQSGCRIDEIWQLFPEWKLESWIPVGRDNFGNYYVMFVINNVSSPVCFVDALQPDTLKYAVASNALEFAKFYLQNEESLNKTGTSTGWPFDRDYVLSCDPGLATFEEDYPMPWNEEDNL